MARGNVLKPWYQSKTLTILVVLWALFTTCLGIMIVVIFVQPHWISGTIQEPKRTVNFGLYRNCTESLNDCSGNLNDFSNIYSDAWKASTIFVALAFISTFLSVAIMLLYWLCCFESSGVGFRASSGLQATAVKCIYSDKLMYMLSSNLTQAPSVECSKEVFENVSLTMNFVGPIKTLSLLENQLLINWYQYCFYEVYVCLDAVLVRQEASNEYKDENLLRSGLQRHRSCHSNEMTLWFIHKNGSKHDRETGIQA
ncbi:unnamed protein product [Porites evermanni]|uniref:Uncharacterized protein n=1 Tax=Porites evermanni TaxID=104178 RepID=A0ABN8M9H8_9CNID|nr:unnamed protein product [Porites evermanni]